MDRRSANPRKGLSVAEIVNLRQARKTRQRQAAAANADAMRALHGETKGEKTRRLQDAERLARTVGGAQRAADIPSDQ